MKTYFISGKHIEFMGAMEVEALNADEAKSKYLQLWNEGMVTTHCSDTELKCTEKKHRKLSKA